MKKLLSLLICGSAVLASSGCWLPHTAHDRPELRTTIGKTGTLTEPCVLFRDRGGRLHLSETEMLAGSTLLEKLPAKTRFKIKDIIYRTTEPGRHDYYVIELSVSSGNLIVEVPAEEKNRPKWSYENGG